MAKDVRLKIYPAIIGVLGICIVALLLARIEVIQEKPGSDGSATTGPTNSLPSSIPPTAPAVVPSPQAQAPPTIAVSKPAPVGAAGKLRVSNQTSYPVRIALLPHQAIAKGTASASSSDYGQPVHWDFAPGEGVNKGLVLSLPDGDLTLQAGDVLVAFAQDGSRRYWGPYVMGKTAQPLWNSQAKEWNLILQP